MLSLSLKLLDAAAMDVAPSGGNGSKYFSLEYVFEDISMPLHSDVFLQESSPVTQSSVSSKPLPKIPPKLPPKPPKPMLPPKPKSFLRVFCTRLSWMEQTNENYTAIRALVGIWIPNGTVNDCATWWITTGTTYRPIAPIHSSFSFSEFAYI